MMLRFLICYAVLAAAVTISQGAVRADATLTPEFEKLRATPDYQAAVYQTAQKSEAWTNNICQGAKAKISNVMAVMKMPTFDAKGAAQSGIWLEHVAVDACPAVRQLNVLLFVKTPGTIESVPLVPGTTRADPTLIRDGVRFAVLAVDNGNSDCKSIYILDTDFLSFADGTAKIPGKPGWTERWTVSRCDKRIPVTMHFTPDKTGTVISAGLDKTGH